jgi:hypothetical protein
MSYEVGTHYDLTHLNAGNAKSEPTTELRLVGVPVDQNGTSLLFKIGRKIPVACY